MGYGWGSSHPLQTLKSETVCRLWSTGLTSAQTIGTRMCANSPSTEQSCVPVSHFFSNRKRCRLWAGYNVYNILIMLLCLLYTYYYYTNYQINVHDSLRLSSMGAWLPFTGLPALMSQRHVTHERWQSGQRQRRTLMLSTAGLGCGSG